MKQKNERNAGRKPKYIGLTKLKRIPILAEKEIDDLLIPYKNKNETDKSNTKISFR